MRLSDVMRILKDDPELYWAVKEEMVFRGKVAGEWTDYDISEESRRKGVQAGSTVRFAPSLYAEKVSHASAVVVSVGKKSRPQEPEPWNGDYTDAESFEEEYDDWVKRKEHFEKFPWRWEVRLGAHTSGGNVCTYRGDAPTFEKAKASADRFLRNAGWVLLNPPLVALAETAEGR